MQNDKKSNHFLNRVKVRPFRALIVRLNLVDNTKDFKTGRVDIEVCAKRYEAKLMKLAGNETRLGNPQVTWSSSKGKTGDYGLESKTGFYPKPAQSRSGLYEDFKFDSKQAVYGLIIKKNGAGKEKVNFVNKVSFQYKKRASDK